MLTCQSNVANPRHNTLYVQAWLYVSQIISVDIPSFNLHYILLLLFLSKYNAQISIWNNSLYKDLAIIYTKENWFVIS